VALMLWTGSVHPPGGALVVILLDSHRFQALGPAYILFPGLTGALLLYVAAAATDALKRRFVFELADVTAALRLAPAPAKQATA
jgi:CBS-domain-containing membrane protein